VSDTEALVEVRIEQVPLGIYREVSEHTDELLREFALIREQDPAESRYVPRRLLALIADITERFSGFSVEQTNQLQAALQRGEKAVDLVYRVPGEVRQATVDLAAMLDEADEFCRRGQELLTLATPPRALAFRRWFLGEFVRQIDGLPPRPWPEYARGAGVEAAGRS
jgi:hypothetical protein